MYMTEYRKENQNEEIRRKKGKKNDGKKKQKSGRKGEGKTERDRTEEKIAKADQRPYGR